MPSSVLGTEDAEVNRTTQQSRGDGAPGEAGVQPGPDFLVTDLCPSRGHSPLNKELSDVLCAGAQGAQGGSSPDLGGRQEENVG